MMYMESRQDTMDWDTLYCPNRGCSCYDRPFHQGLLIKNGTTRGQKQALCRACGRSIALNTGTEASELRRRLGREIAVGVCLWRATISTIFIRSNP